MPLLGNNWRRKRNGAQTEEDFFLLTLGSCVWAERCWQLIKCDTNELLQDGQHRLTGLVLHVNITKEQLDGIGNIPKSAVGKSHLHRAVPTQGSCMTYLYHILKQMTEQGYNQKTFTLFRSMWKQIRCRMCGKWCLFLPSGHEGPYRMNNKRAWLTSGQGLRRRFSQNCLTGRFGQWSNRTRRQ